ncbi:MAG: CarD family transcriptional regulator [Bacillota bacterium]|nr:CarD family transcriptional regulator [Bacillota bacterium]
MINSTYEKGNYVVYGTEGICVIDDITEMSFMAGMEKSRYYVLKPEGSNGSKVYVPAENENLMSKLRPLMTKQELDMLLTGMRDKELEWEKDKRLRTELFHGIMAKGVTESLLLMIRCIYLKKNELENKGRKLPASDGNTLKTAEKLVEEEFACVLGIEKKDVGSYIRRMIGTE